MLEFLSAVGAVVSSIVETVVDVISQIVDTTIWEVETGIALVKAMPGEQGDARKERVLRALIDGVDSYCLVLEKHHAGSSRTLIKAGYPVMAMFTKEGGRIFREAFRASGYLIALAVIEPTAANFEKVRVANGAFLQVCARLTYAPNLEAIRNGCVTEEEVDAVMKAAIAHGIAPLPTRVMKGKKPEEVVLS